MTNNSTETLPDRLHELGKTLAMGGWGRDFVELVDEAATALEAAQPRPNVEASWNALTKEHGSSDGTWLAIGKQDFAAVLQSLPQQPDSALREAAEEAKVLIGARNDQLSEAARQANINAAWHKLDAALSLPTDQAGEL